MDDIENRNPFPEVNSIFNSGKKNKRPLVDLESFSFSPVETKKVRPMESLLELPQEEVQSDDSKYSRIDVDKEMEKLFGKPTVELKASARPSPMLKLESTTSGLQQSINEFRSFVSESISQLSERLAHSNQQNSSLPTSSLSQSSAVDSEDIKRILEYVRENNTMLKTLTATAIPSPVESIHPIHPTPSNRQEIVSHPASSSSLPSLPFPSSSSSSSSSSSTPSMAGAAASAALQKEIDKLKDSLDAEVAKSAKLLSMLQDAISENDVLSEELMTVRESLSMQTAAASEYALLNRGLEINAQQSEEDVLTYRSQCTRLQTKIEQLQKQLWLARRPSRYSNCMSSDDEKEEKVLPLSLSSLSSLSSSLQITGGNQENENENENEKTNSSMEEQLTKLQQTIHTYEFTNQLLVQQLAESRMNARQKSDQKEEELQVKVGKLEKKVRELDEIKSQLEKENEEMKQLLAKTDLPDYQFIEDSEEEGEEE